MYEKNETELADLWRDALDQYARDTEKSLSIDEILALRQLQSIEDISKHIQTSEATFKTFRTKNHRLWSALTTFAAPITTIANLAITPSSVVDFGSVSSAVLGAVVYLLKACEGVSNAYDWVEQLFRELQDFSERIGLYITTTTTLDAVLRRKIVAILAVILKVLGRSQKLVREKRFREYLRVTFLGKDATTKKLVDELNKVLGSEQRYVLGVTYASTQRTEEVTKATHDAVHKVLDVVEEERDKRSREEDESRLRNTLHGTSANHEVEEIFVRNERALLKGTGAWLEDEPFFNSWMRREATILWIFGGPGAGKSFLSTRLIQILQEKVSHTGGGNGEAVAYFFVKENSETLRDANTLLKTLAWQIATQDMAFRRHAIVVCRQRALTVTPDLTWENLFLGYYVPSSSSSGGERNSGGCVTIVIDGLDEANPETRQTMLGLMKGLVTPPAGGATTSSSGGIQLAVVGRGSLRSDMDFNRLEKNYFIEVSRAKNRHDIESYIKKRLGELDILREMRKMKPHGQARANREGGKIMKRVAEGADGVFLWAKLLLDSLMKKDLPQIEAILASPPLTLDKMIWSVFDRLAKDEELDQHVLRKMLMFMTHARRPLLFGELDLVTSLPARKPNYLLWKHTRGKLSSVFDLKFPKDVDPDDDDDDDDDGGEPTAEEKKKPDVENGDDASYIGGSDDDADFDFDYEHEENSTDEQGVISGDDDDDIFSTAQLARAETLNANPDSDGDKAAELEDLLSHLTAGKVQTRVSFCHTRIRDFLAQEGDPLTRRSEPLSIIPGIDDDVQTDITIACLDILRLELSLNDEKRFLADYPLCHLPFHLEGVDRSTIPPEKTGMIIDGLYWLFGTERGALCLLKAPPAVIREDEFQSSNKDLWRLWVGTDKYIKLVQSWFREIESFREYTACDSNAVSWMLEAASSLEVFLKPAIHTASKMWLCQPGFDSETYFDKGDFPAWLVNGWLTLIETGVPLPEPATFFDFDQVTPERLEHTAKYVGLEQDVHWHTLLGWSLMLGYHYPHATAHYQQAVELDPMDWVALEGLARCAGEQGDHVSAIAWQEKAIDALPENLHWISGFLWPRISDWAGQLGDTETAFKSAIEGFRANVRCTLAETTYITLLDQRGRSVELVECLRKLAATDVPGASYNALVRLFVRNEDVFEAIGRACAKEGRPEFVLEALKEAMDIVDGGDREEVKIVLPYKAGRFKYTFYGLEQAATTLLESFLKRLAQKNESVQRVHAVARKDARNLLAQLYFDAAVSEWKSVPTRDSRPASADKLKQLAVGVSTGFGDDYEGFDLFRTDYPAMLWGRWLRDYKGVEGGKWRKCFRARLLEEMNTVDDDDPTNDTLGISSLAISLFHAGDRANAAAIMAILFRAGTTKSPQTTDMNPEAAEKTNGLKLNISQTESMSHACSNCQKGLEEVSELHICEVCPGQVSWCVECLALLRAPEERKAAPYLHRCNPFHDFYRAWPIPPEALHVAAQSFENGVTVRMEWLEELRRQWWA